MKQNRKTVRECDHTIPLNIATNNIYYSQNDVNTCYLINDSYIAL